MRSILQKPSKGAQDYCIYQNEAPQNFRTELLDHEGRQIVQGVLITSSFMLEVLRWWLKDMNVGKSVGSIEYKRAI